MKQKTGKRKKHRHKSCSFVATPDDAHISEGDTEDDDSIGVETRMS